MINFIIAISMIVSPIVLGGNTDPWNGYTDSWGNYVPGLITNDTWMTPAPQFVSGKAVFYNPLAMLSTAIYRGIDYEKEGCMSPIDIGKKAWVKLPKESLNDEITTQWVGPFCVVDCARKGDMYSVIVYRGEVVEFSYTFAEKLGMVTSRAGSDYIVNQWSIPVEVLVTDGTPYEYYSQNLKNLVHCFHVGEICEGLEDYNSVPYIDYFLDTLEFATGWEPRVILTADGRWKEWGEDVYWDAP